MTTYFVSNAGSNTAPYDTEAKAATTLGVIQAVPWVAGDIVKVSSTHTETAGVAITYTFPTTVGLQILSVTFNGSGTGGLAAGAAINVGAANAALGMPSGFAYVYGVAFASGTNNNAACDINIGNTGNVLINITLDTCTLSIPSVAVTALLNLGPIQGVGRTDNIIKMVDTVISHGAAARSIAIRQVNLVMDGCSLAGTAPTTVFLPLTQCPANILLTGCDLSAAWTNLIDVSINAPVLLVARQCKLASGFTVATGAQTGPAGADIILQDCDSGDVQYSYIRSNWSGTITTSGSIYQDASDGTNSFSLYMSASANASWTWPLISPQIVRFNSGTSAVSATVEVDNDGTTFKDNELWLEVLAKVSTGFTLGTWNRGDRSNILAAGSNQDTSSVSWTGTGGFGAEVKQKLVSGSFTPAEVGPVVGVVKLAKASDDVYVSPHMTLA